MINMVDYYGGGVFCWGGLEGKGSSERRRFFCGFYKWRLEFHCANLSLDFYLFIHRGRGGRKGPQSPNLMSTRLLFFGRVRYATWVFLVGENRNVAEWV